MNKNEVIVTDAAVLSSAEICETLDRIEALTQSNPAEALMLLYTLLRTVRIVRRAINEKPLRQYERHIAALTQIEDDLWTSAHALNNIVCSSAN